MLFRALFVSLAAHLLILIDWSPGGREANAGQGASTALRAMLSARGKSASAENTVSPEAIEAARRSSVIRHGSQAASATPSRERVLAGPAPTMSDAQSDILHARSEDGPSADALRQYRLEIARAARRLTRHPALLPGREWVGELMVLIRIDSTAAAHAVELAVSSGQPELDSAVLDLVDLAVRSASLPESLRGRPIILNLPIRYAAQGE